MNFYDHFGILPGPTQRPRLPPNRRNLPKVVNLFADNLINGNTPNAQLPINFGVPGILFIWRRGCSQCQKMFPNLERLSSEFSRSQNAIVYAIERGELNSRNHLAITGQPWITKNLKLPIIRFFDRNGRFVFDYTGELWYFHILAAFCKRFPLRNCNALLGQQPTPPPIRPTTPRGIITPGVSTPAPFADNDDEDDEDQNNNTTNPIVSLQKKWGQCGGRNYSGPTQCEPGSQCVHQSEWYSQCM
jgi:hypothetical protein